MHIPVAFVHNRSLDRFFGNDPENHFVDVRFALFVVIFIADKCQVVICDPLFKHIGAGAQRLTVTIPLPESLFGITVMFSKDEEIFPAKVNLIFRIWIRVSHKYCELIYLFYRFSCP